VYCGAPGALSSTYIVKGISRRRSPSLGWSGCNKRTHNQTLYQLSYQRRLDKVGCSFQSELRDRLMMTLLKDCNILYFPGPGTNSVIQFTVAS
jgi:hypothetical protein